MKRKIHPLTVSGKDRKVKLKREIERIFSVKSEKETIIKVTKAAQAKGITIMPSAQDLVKNYCVRIESKGWIKTEENFVVCSTALISAGIMEAHEKGKKIVTPGDIKEGWHGRLCMGPGNCPPHKCARLSIIERVTELKDELPIFNELLDIEER